jgi:hypothetical protein
MMLTLGCLKLAELPAQPEFLALTPRGFLVYPNLEGRLRLGSFLRESDIGTRQGHDVRDQRLARSPLRVDFRFEAG